MKFWTMVVLIGFGKNVEDSKDCVMDFYKACPFYTVIHLSLLQELVTSIM